MTAGSQTFILVHGLHVKAFSVTPLSGSNRPKVCIAGLTPATYSTENSNSKTIYKPLFTVYKATHK
jgi:hypothetical protein